MSRNTQIGFFQSILNAQTSFNPIDLNPEFYWSAESGVFVDNAETTIPTDGQNIAVIRDANHIFNQTTGGSPTWHQNEVNGHPAVQFDGSNDFLENSTLATGIPLPDTPSTVIFVMKPNVVLNAGSPWVFTDAASSRPYYRNFRGMSTGDYQFYERDLSGTDKQIFWGTVTADWQYLTMLESGTLGNFYKNGTQIVFDADTDVGANSFSRMWLGKGFSGGQYFDGYIASIFIKWAEVTSTELTQLHNFFSSKYGI